MQKQIRQEQEQDRKINSEKYSPKHRPSSVVQLYRITDSPGGWTSIQGGGRSNSVLPKVLQGEGTGSSHTRAHLFLHFNDKIEQDWSPWFCPCPHKTLFTEGKAYGSISDLIIILLWTLHWFPVTLKIESTLLTMVLPLNSSLPSYLSGVPPASLCPSTLNSSLAQHSHLAFAQWPSPAVLPSGNVLPRSPPAQVSALTFLHQGGHLCPPHILPFKTMRIKYT